MPLINLCKATDEGARGTHYQAGYYHHSEKGADGYFGPVYAPGPMAYWTRLSHVGLCLKDYERNGYDDSDFHMIVWNPAKHEPEDICFASTRGWSYPCYGSSPDATPEVRAAYAQYLDGLERCAEIARRKARADELRRYRTHLRHIARDHSIPYQRLLRAKRLLGSDLTNQLLTLFNMRLRSKFKLSLREQVIAWFRADNPKFARPLSAKQMECLW